MSIEERRRRRDQRLAVDEATQIVKDAASAQRTITLEWAAVAVLLALGAAGVTAAWYRHLDLVYIGTAAWAGMVLGALLAHASLQVGRARLIFLPVALFAGIPLAAIPWRFFAPERDQWPLFALAAVGAGLVAGAVRWIVTLRETLGTMESSMASAGGAVSRGTRAFLLWLHDAAIKWVAALLVMGIGAGLVYLGRMQHQPTVLWVGVVVFYLFGAVGLWAPGLYRRTPWPMALRHCGQLCLWLSLLAVPYVELQPGAALPFLDRPSIRFIAAGLGLVVIGATWFVQRSSIFSHRSHPESKDWPERLVALLALLLGLVATLAAAQGYQRSRVTIDQTSIAQTNLVGSLVFEPTEQIKSLQIVQPVERVPFYLEYVQFTDNKTFRIIPLAYPDNQLNPDDSALVQAIRTAGGLTRQTFPESRVEQWSR